MKKLYIILAFLLIIQYGSSQTTTLTYPTLYHTTPAQNLWQQGTAGIFQIDQVFFNQTWNTSTTVGQIYNVAGYQFGARITAGTWGEIGSGLKINFGTETVEIDYDADMKIVKPTDYTWEAGDQITLNTYYTPKEATSEIVASEYDANLRLWLKFGMGISMSANVCVFSCTNFNIFNISLPTDTHDIVYFSTTSGLSLLDGLIEYPIEDNYNYNYDDIIDINFHLPDNTGASSYISGTELHSEITNPSAYFDVYFSIPKFIGALNIPYVSAFFDNLSNSWTYGPFYLNYTLMEAGFYLGLYHKQHLTLRPTMKGNFKLPAKVDYAVVHPTNGTIISSGFDSIINYNVGQKIRINYPCNFEHMDIVPSFSMTNTFTNHTYDSIALDFVFDMLEFNIGMNDVTVIPEICIPIYYPCGPWYCVVCDWCFSHNECTPAVVFHGFNWGFGPLVHWQPNLFNVKYNWCNNTWPMGGFNSFPNQSSFRLQPRKFSVALSSNQILCNGGLTGTATATVTNGRPPYTYQWSNGVTVTKPQSTDSQSGLGAGAHWVSVKDNNGCVVFESVFINQPEFPLSVLSDFSDPKCFDSFDGSITANISGGTPTYSYIWNTGANTAQINGLDAGNYTVTVTDFNGCQLTQSYVLDKPDDIVYEVESQQVMCNGGNSGWILIETDGGVPPYNYSWSNSGTSNLQLNLSAGTYVFTITDFNLCAKTDSVVIAAPLNPLSVAPTISDVPCYGTPGGIIDLTSSGGTAPYSYSWFDSQFVILNNFSSQLHSVLAGNYNVIVTDAFGCADTLLLTIQQPDPLQSQFNIQDVLCHGLSTGSIELTLNGATPPFTYYWSEGSSTENIYDLPAGNYLVTVTDANLCEYVLETNISQPAAELNASTIVTDVRCFGDSTGIIETEVIGGTSPFTYLWSNSSISDILQNVPAGTYSLTVTDNNGCLSYTGGVVNQPEEPVTIDAILSDALCNGSDDGSVDLTIYGGTLPYTLIWDDNSYVMQTNNQTIGNLPSGIFNLQITDGNNCTMTQTYVIGQPDPMISDILTSPVNCFSGNDGTATISVVGGTEPYTYEWSNGWAGQVLSGVSSGTYVITVTDGNGCVYIAETTIGSYPELIADWQIVPVSCKDKDDAAIYVYVSGGAGSYQYLWSNSSTESFVDQLAPGSYTLVVTDLNSCELPLDFSILENLKECLKIPSSFTPNADGVNDTWVLSNINTYPDASVQIFNKWGNLLFETNGVYSPWDGKYNANPVPAETYYYIIILGNGDEPYTGTVTIIR